MATGTSHGFSIIEGLIASLLLGMLLAAALPSLHTVLAAHRLSSSLSSTAGYARLTRAVAVAQNRDARLQIDDSGRRLTIEVLRDGDWQPVRAPLFLAEGFVVEAVAPGTLTFRPQGLATATTTITVGNARGAFGRIAVSLLGRVEVSS